MSKRISGAKRLQIIQNWLNGRDDDEWEVFPTKTEGKYFIKPRKQNNITPQDDPSSTPKVDPVAPSLNTPKVDPSLNTPKVDPSTTSHKQSNYDPTIEILNQLKLLGEEMRNNTKRDRKATKRMIKNVVKRQISKPRTPFYDYSQEHNPDTQSRTLSRRNNIFADVVQ